MTAWALLMSRYCMGESVLVNFPVSVKPKKFKDIKLGLVNTNFYFFKEEGDFLNQLERGATYIGSRTRRFTLITHLLEAVNREAQDLFNIGFKFRAFKRITHSEAG